jgi:uncharacterized protein YihD (DUF1040 family)
MLWSEKPRFKMPLVSEKGPLNKYDSLLQVINKLTNNRGYRKSMMEVDQMILIWQCLW